MYIAYCRCIQRFDSLNGERHITRVPLVKTNFWPQDDEGGIRPIATTICGGGIIKHVKTRSPQPAIRRSPGDQLGACGLIGRFARSWIPIVIHQLVRPTTDTRYGIGAVVAAEVGAIAFIQIVFYRRMAPLAPYNTI